MTPFERAQIRLRAWEAVAGWGTTKDKDQLPEPWNWQDRLKFADQLAEWALNDPVANASDCGKSENT